MYRGETKEQNEGPGAITITISLGEFEEVFKRWIAECQLNTQTIQADNQKTYLTRVEAAKELHVSLPTLSSYIKLGIVPAKRIGARILIPVDALRNALQNIATKTSKFSK